MVILLNSWKWSVDFKKENILVKSGVHTSHRLCLQEPGILNLEYFIEVELIYKVVLISVVQQCDSDMYSFFYILFHYGLSQDTEYSSLCSTVGPCCLSIVYTIACIC